MRATPRRRGPPLEAGARGPLPGGVGDGPGLVTLPSERPGPRGRRPASVLRVPASDVALAVLIGVLSLISFTERASLLLESADGPLHFASPDLLGGLQVLVGCLALAWRRTAPGVVLLVCVASTIGRYAEHYPVMPLPYAVLVAVYTVAQRWPLRHSAIAVGVVAAGMAASAMILLSPSLDDEPMIDAVAVLTAGGLGRGVRMRQVRTALLEDRARLLEEQSPRLAQEQSTMAELAAARERESIARELHDIVANNVSVIAAQAASSRRAADRSRTGDRPTTGDGPAPLGTQLQPARRPRRRRPTRHGRRWPPSVARPRDPAGHAQPRRCPAVGRQRGRLPEPCPPRPAAGAGRQGPGRGRTSG